MMLWVAAATIGILVIIILIYKYVKTSKDDVLGYSTYCKTCGKKIDGWKCPTCTQKNNNWR